ncbi:ABC transporter permease [Ponticoccus sp. SC2-23]|uniref:ABC transporter permease n=1 Tax=Alexandriicola marinus TaxID=2081710 RepID=UPI000FD8484D|nr:ABC transporter permease [Alexandriicola marinus]MBM1221780.1 ABC transporter permease [Ponticoccus sp. SC6-9]MBM1226131.1 ABC transporter permease [Ponticoccus sp. SC6-15]MBM1230727.1 ABC transporter permease [Ponticoccus sp. SC6-38]MBM1235432.1 ABC transporter permease [Ponticoccus sp. SC6-45]MBM1239749.1 ABC transporter permease [Ponticoccus sp. SC6-49]MBM1243893.1 ABC transporter permease [Ponticoccus sp. SC2-64]MBM1248956.1 ABC transporter permease [Ponticoccus sp. SC6-42]MBM1253404
MSVFVITYFGLLIATSCAAAYWNQRGPFLTLFSLTLVSFVLGIVGGAGALRFVAIAAGMIAFAAGISYAFREFLVLITSHNLSKEIKTAPLTASFGMFVIFTYAVAGIFAPWIAPYGESEVISSAFAPADENMLLGADQLGRDMFSRIIYGARNTVGLALLATVAAFLMGAFAGLLAATKGGWFDQVLGRIADIIMSIPSLIFALLMLSIFGPQVIVIIVAVAIIYAPRVFRLTRAVAGNVVVMDYIEAAKLRGEKTWYLIRREILPNSTAPLIAEFGLEFCFVFLLVAGLSFLGLGVQPPTADWGSMVRENATLISFGEITPLIPAAAIALLTVAVNFVVDWMLFRSSGLKEQ